MNKNQIAEVFGTLNDEQRDAVCQMLEDALSKNAEPEAVEHSEKVDVKQIFEDGVKFGSLKESILCHAETYGIQEIEQLFPEPKNLNNPPQFLNNEIGWVSTVLNGVHKSPFARIKSQFADITEDAIRAKGYLKTHEKKEHVFGMLKRTTGPTTIYTKQKIDRDDVIDITDFNVVSWIKEEMRLKLNEEIARAIIIGDGRLSSDNDHIDPECIRPIFNDADLYTIKAQVDKNAANQAKEFIKTCIIARKDYEGTGTPTLYTTEDVLCDLLLIEDQNGRFIYESVSALCNVLRVSKIVTVPVMKGLVRTDSDQKKYDVLGIIVNPNDYHVGADKGGQVAMFDDFDIDYNQYKYLMETRCSGSLIKPYSAITIEKAQA